MVACNLPGPFTARAPRHVSYVPQWLIRPWGHSGSLPFP